MLVRLLFTGTFMISMSDCPKFVIYWVGMTFREVIKALESVDWNCSGCWSLLSKAFLFILLFGVTGDFCCCFFCGNFSVKKHTNTLFFRAKLKTGEPSWLTLDNACPLNREVHVRGSTTHQNTKKKSDSLLCHTSLSNWRGIWTMKLNEPVTVNTTKGICSKKGTVLHDEPLKFTRDTSAEKPS